MIKINRTTEYGLMALRHMTRKRLTDRAGVTSAREVADVYGLPFEITAKTLQRLKDAGLIQSAQGAKGGYTILRNLEEVNLAEFLDLMEGPQMVVACSTKQEPVAESVAGSCSYHPRCEIKHLMSHLSQRVYQFLSEIQLAELTRVPESEAISFFSVTGAGAPAQLREKQ
ncbi:MAG: Rrf2 family transcriptional regulator [Oligoflexia bacterium]|nr:Rrf2 family transcriptional regulator [Oligoflexia bacterium]